MGMTKEVDEEQPVIVEPQLQLQHKTDETNHKSPDSGWFFRDDVEGLRGLAVILVLLFHARIPGIPGGFIGVDVFFVISGFVITGMILKEIHDEGSLNLAKFFFWRVRRLLPNSVLCLLMTVFVGHWILDPISELKVLDDAKYVSLYCINIKYAQISNYFVEQDSPSPLIHYWSLATEEQFYVVWPFVLYLFTYGSTKLGWFKRVGIPLSLLLASFLFGLSESLSDDSSVAFFTLPSRAWQLLSGALIGLNYSYIKNVNQTIRSLGSIVGMAAVLISSTHLSKSVIYPGWAALLPTMGTALIICGDSSLLVGRLLCLPPVRWMGVKSYALYLFHWPAVVYNTILSSPKFGYSPTTYSCALGVWISVPLALLVNNYVETPIRRGGNKIPYGVGIALGVLAGVVCLGITYQMSESVALINYHGE